MPIIMVVENFPTGVERSKSSVTDLNSTPFLPRVLRESMATWMLRAHRSMVWTTTMSNSPLEESSSSSRNFGRLAMELWRACRLVVDTGIHYKKWTREQGIEYYANNTPNPKDDAVKMVERHIIMAGQATAYKIGMIKILELREMAKQKLGEDFDIRQFHDVVLTNGPVPLNVLENLVNEWIANARS